MLSKKFQNLGQKHFEMLFSSALSLDSIHLILCRNCSLNSLPIRESILSSVGSFCNSMNILFSTSFKVDGFWHVSGVGNHNCLYSGLSLAGCGAAIRSSAIISWLISISKSSRILSWANVSSCGSIGVSVSAYWSERKLKYAMSEFQVIVISLP